MSPVRVRCGAVAASVRKRRGVVGGDVVQAAVMFAAAGLVSILYDVVAVHGEHRRTALLIDSSLLLAGLAIWALPWHRWTRLWRLALPILALAHLSFGRVIGVVPDDTYAIWLVLVFVWVGLNQPPSFGLRLAPVALVTYTAPLALGISASSGAIASLVIAIPMSILIAESLSGRASAVRRANAERESALDALAKASVTDDLTGLGNRRHANTMLDALEDGDALVILDFDHFKTINDQLGHQRGDQLLQDLGAFLAARWGGSHRAARYGGEEFIAVLPAGQADDPLQCVCGLLEGWRATTPIATLSVGVAVKQRGSSSSDTFANADAALYQAKQSGRDRAVLWPIAPTPRDAVDPAVTFQVDCVAIDH